METMMMMLSSLYAQIPISFRIQTTAATPFLSFLIILQKVFRVPCSGMQVGWPVDGWGRLKYRNPKTICVLVFIVCWVALHCSLTSHPSGRMDDTSAVCCEIRVKFQVMFRKYPLTSSLMGRISSGFNPCRVDKSYLSSLIHDIIENLGKVESQTFAECIVNFVLNFHVHIFTNIRQDLVAHPPRI